MDMGKCIHNQLHSHFFERLGGRIGIFIYIYISTIHWFTLWRNQSKTQNGPAWQRNHATCENVRLPLSPKLWRVMTPFPHTQNKKKTRKVCWNLVDWLWIKICWTSTHLNKNPWLQVVTIWPILQSQTRTKKIGTLLNPSWLQHAKNRTTTPSKPQHPQHSPARELSNGRWFRNSCGCTSCYAIFNIPIFMVGLIHARWLAGFLNRQHWQSKF